jgi:hypothetical protein
VFTPGFDHRTTDTLMDSLSVDMAKRRRGSCGVGRERCRMSVTESEDPVLTPATSRLNFHIVRARRRA